MLTWHKRGLPSCCSCWYWSRLAGLLCQLRSQVSARTCSRTSSRNRSSGSAATMGDGANVVGATVVSATCEAITGVLSRHSSGRDLRGDRRQRDLRGDYRCTLSQHSSGRDLRGDYRCTLSRHSSGRELSTAWLTPESAAPESWVSESWA